MNKVERIKCESIEYHVDEMIITINGGEIPTKVLNNVEYYTDNGVVVSFYNGGKPTKE